MKKPEPFVEGLEIVKLPTEREKKGLNYAIVTPAVLHNSTEILMAMQKKQMYGGTVSPKAKHDRRVRNSAAKRSRRLNRGNR